MVNPECGCAVQCSPDALERGVREASLGTENVGRWSPYSRTGEARVWAWGSVGVSRRRGAVEVIPLDVLRFDSSCLEDCFVLFL